MTNELDTDEVRRRWAGITNRAAVGAATAANAITELTNELDAVRNERSWYRSALQTIADGDGDADEIARQTLRQTGER